MPQRGWDVFGGSHAPSLAPIGYASSACTSRVLSVHPPAHRLGWKFPKTRFLRPGKLFASILQFPSLSNNDPVALLFPLLRVVLPLVPLFWIEKVLRWSLLLGVDPGIMQACQKYLGKPAAVLQFLVSTGGEVRF